MEFSFSSNQSPSAQESGLVTVNHWCGPIHIQGLINHLQGLILLSEERKRNRRRKNAKDYRSETETMSIVSRL